VSKETGICCARRAIAPVYYIVILVCPFQVLQGNGFNPSHNHVETLRSQALIL
jgi:hypothetical protein